MPNTLPNVVYSQNSGLNNSITDNGQSFDPSPNAGLGFPTTNAMLEVGRKSNYTPTTLGATEKTYTGNQDDIITIANWVVKNKWSYSVKENPNQIYSITVNVPYDEITVNDDTKDKQIVWEISPNIVSRNIFDAGIFFASNGTLSTQRFTVPPVVQEAILLAVKNNGTIKLANEPKYAPLAGIAEQFYSYIKAGVTSVRAYTITVRRTAVYAIDDPASSKDYPTIGDSNDPNTINPIISTNDLINLFGVDDVTKPHLINSYVRRKTYTGQGDPVDLYAYGGYLVGKPTRQYITPTKVQIVQHFEFDEWLDGLYPNASAIGDFTFPNPTPYPPSFSGS